MSDSRYGLESKLAREMRDESCEVEGARQTRLRGEAPVR
jgi:hypothetical protein